MPISINFSKLFFAHDAQIASTTPIASSLLVRSGEFGKCYYWPAMPEGNMNYSATEKYANLYGVYLLNDTMAIYIERTAVAALTGAKFTINHERWNEST